MKSAMDVKQRQKDGGKQLIDLMSDNTISNTPRTYEVVTNSEPHGFEVVPADFARGLEQEIYLAKARIVELEDWKKQAKFGAACMAAAVQHGKREIEVLKAQSERAIAEVLISVRYEVAQEREACAQVCEAERVLDFNHALRDAADAIRARGNP